MSLKLTETMRQRITTALLQHRFEKEELALKRREHDVAMKVHRLRYDASMRKRMEALPSGWLPTASRVWVKAATIGGTWLGYTEPVRLPTGDQGAYVYLDKIKNSDAVAAAVIDLHGAKQAYDERRAAIASETTKTLASFGTVARLLAAWPELKPFTDKLGFDASKKSLPAVIPGELNKSLGLPVTH